MLNRTLLSFWACLFLSTAFGDVARGPLEIPLALPSVPQVEPSDIDTSYEFVSTIDALETIKASCLQNTSLFDTFSIMELTRTHSFINALISTQKCKHGLS